jgi:hypothetical protein
VKRSVWCGIFASVALAWGCAGGAGSAGPQASLSAYADALAEGRADDAYQLLSSEAKRSISLEAFRRMVKENPEDVADIARALRRPGSDPLVTATVLSPDGDQLVLVYENGRWRIDGTGIDRYGQATPRQAIEGFVRAFERKRYDILMHYVPDKELAGEASGRWWKAKAGPSEADAGAEPAPQESNLGGLTAENLRKEWEGDGKDYITRYVQAIKAALPSAKIEQTEDHAAMSYGGVSVFLIREDGLWKISDLN